MAAIAAIRKQVRISSKGGASVGNDSTGLALVRSISGRRGIA